VRYFCAAFGPKLTVVTGASPYPSSAAPRAHALWLNPDARQAVPWFVPLSRYRHVEPAGTSVVITAPALDIIANGANVNAITANTPTAPKRRRELLIARIPAP
jgi:hypothetical protein